MRLKLDKEREKMKYLDEKLAAMEKNKDQIDANNATLNTTFLVKIENRDFAFLPLAREFVEERD
jgi:hypothetical protein